MPRFGAVAIEMFNNASSHAKSYIIGNYFAANMTLWNLGGDINMEGYTPAKHFYSDGLFWLGFILFVTSGSYTFWATYTYKVHHEGPHVSQKALANILAIANQGNRLGSATRINIIGFAILVLLEPLLGLHRFRLGDCP